LRYVSALGQLLERLRRVRPAPGAAASVVAVPSAGDRLAGEVSFLFDHLDGIERHRELLIASALSDAAALEAAAARERHRLLEDAGLEAERVAAELLAERRARSERRARALLAEAEREAERALARGRERTPALVAELLALVLESAG
jgi:vacuolar-type H+-ATPase subunit H